MDLIDHIKALATKIPNMIDLVQTEEATKHAFILPFIRALGYDDGDPREVIPEFGADIPKKKGEKVDYAIMLLGKAVMLFECKSCHTNLAEVHAEQLYHYFHNTDARIGVLTNGLTYLFFSDLEDKNKMDEKPFLEFNILDVNDVHVSELKKFTKSAFNLDETVDNAKMLKYKREIKLLLTEILADKSNKQTEEFVKFITAQVFPGSRTKSVIEQFTEITKKAFKEFIEDRIQDRFNSARKQEVEKEKPLETQTKDQVIEIDTETTKIVTTEEEKEAYHIIRAILSEKHDVNRFALRDTKSYCGVLLDDKNYKTICRLRFNTAQKYIGIVTPDKKEHKVAIENLSEIFKYADLLKESVRLYDETYPPNK